jgi:hypothetical protein
MNKRRAEIGHTLQDDKTADIFEEERRRDDETKRLTGEAEAKKKEDAFLSLLGGLPYDRDRVVNEIRFYMNQTAHGIIETGKRFLALRAKEPHGKFIPLVEDELGVDYRTAARFMAIARKFANVTRVTHLVFQDLKKGIGKLYALLEIPDEELREFEETGELRGLTMDEIDALPVKEVRDRLRGRNKQVEQGILALTERDKKIETLEEEIHTLRWPKRADHEEKFILRMEALKKSFDGWMLQMEPDGVRELQRDANPQPNDRMKAAYVSALQYMKMQMLAAWDGAIEKFGDPVTMPEEVIWHQPGENVGSAPLPLLSAIGQFPFSVV